MATSLAVRNIVKKFGDFTALDNVSIDIEPGKFVTLLGPSGCGKTTLLRTIAGFLDPEEGEVLFNGKVMNDVPPNKRNAAMCFQSYALFPHKTVYENIRFGLRMKKVPESEQKTRIDEVVKMVNLIGLCDRKPYELSGGQQQRVALARAIVVRPNILLFDEPLSNLDAKLRERVRIEIREVQKSLGITSIYVTHDQAEALAISDTIVSMNEGRIIQLADPRTVYDKPATKFVADFIGTANIIDGEVIYQDGNIAKISSAIGEIISSDIQKQYGKSITMCIRPEDIYLKSQGEPNENTIKAKVKYAVYMGNALDLFVEIGGQVIRASVSKDYIINEGEEISIVIPGKKVNILEG